MLYLFVDNVKSQDFDTLVETVDVSDGTLEAGCDVGVAAVEVGDDDNGATVQDAESWL